MHKTKLKLNPSFFEDRQTDISYANLNIYIHIYIEDHSLIRKQ